MGTVDLGITAGFLGLLGLVGAAAWSTRKTAEPTHEELERIYRDGYNAKIDWDSNPYDIHRDPARWGAWGGGWLHGHRSQPQQQDDVVLRRWLTEAYIEGWTARGDGLHLADNPFSASERGFSGTVANAQRRAWAAGWADLSPVEHVDDSWIESEIRRLS